MCVIIQGSKFKKHTEIKGSKMNTNKVTFQPSGTCLLEQASKNNNQKPIKCLEIDYKEMLPTIFTEQELKLIDLEKFPHNFKVWLSKFAKTEGYIESDINHFPWKPSKTSVVFNETFKPEWQAVEPDVTSISSDESPVFVINIPAVLPKNTKAKIDFSECIKKIELIRDEAFGINKFESNQSAKSQLAIVIGFNACLTFGEKSKKYCEEFFRSIPKVEGVAFSVLGFFWSPKNWQLNCEDDEIYHPEIAYLLLKKLRPQAAKLLRKLFRERSGQFSDVTIPYQKIRERIKNSFETKKKVEFYRSKCPKNPLYLSILDWDTISLKSDNDRGVFSHYTDMIQKLWNERSLYPCIISTGYKASALESKALQFGIRLDMQVREVLSKIFGNGPYYPEPSISIRIQSDHTMENFSFLGEGNNVESRRLIQNGLGYGKHGKIVFDTSTMIYSSIGSVTTDVKRLSTAKINKFTEINPKIVSQKGFLESLKGIGQTHLHCHQWAENVYLALPIKVSQTTEITKHLQSIYQVFDPIQLTFSYAKSFQNTYSKVHFDNIMNIFQNFCLVAIDLIENNKKVDDCCKLFALQYFPNENSSDYLNFYGFVKVMLSQLQVAHDSLSKLSLNAEWLKKILRASFESGLVVFKALDNIRKS